MKKIVVFLALFTSLVWSHPHTFIDLYPTLHVKDNMITKIHIKWVMDDMSSSMLIMEFDENGNGKIDTDENQYVYENYFLSLIDYNYYINIIVNGKMTLLPKIQNFKATIEGNRVCYSFDLEKDYDIKNTRFEFYDEEFFVGIMLKKEFVTVKNKKVKITGVDKDFYYMYRLELQ